MSAHRWTSTPRRLVCRAVFCTNPAITVSWKPAPPRWLLHRMVWGACISRPATSRPTPAPSPWAWKSPWSPTMWRRPISGRWPPGPASWWRRRHALGAGGVVCAVPGRVAGRAVYAHRCLAPRQGLNQVCARFACLPAWLQAVCGAANLRGSRPSLRLARQRPTAFRARCSARTYSASPKASQFGLGRGTLWRHVIHTIDTRFHFFEESA